MLNGFRSSINTPTDVRDSPLAAGILTLSKLNPYKDAMTISATQRQVLNDKRDELQTVLLSRKSRLEQEIQETEGWDNIRRKDSTTSEASQEGSPRVQLDRVESDADLEEKISAHQRTLDELHKYFQGQLDFLNKRFQREWLHNPDNRDTDREQVKIPGGGMDSSYLAGCVGRALQVALAEVAEKRPPDPVEYLAICLYQHRANLHRAQQSAVQELKLVLERDDAERKLNQKIRLEREANVIKLEEERRKEIFELRESAVAESIKLEMEKARAEAEEAERKAAEEAKKAEEEAKRAEEEAKKLEQGNGSQPGEEGGAEDEGKRVGYENGEEDYTSGANAPSGGEDQEEAGEDKSLFTIDEQEQD